MAWQVQPLPDSCIPYGYRFLSRLLRFRSSFLLMPWKKQWKMARLFGSLPPVWETHMKLLAPGFTLGQPWPSHLSGESTSRSDISLCVCNSFKINKYFFKNKMDYANLHSNSQCIRVLFSTSSPSLVILSLCNHSHHNGGLVLVCISVMIMMLSTPSYSCWPSVCLHCRNL